MQSNTRRTCVQPDADLHWHLGVWHVDLSSINCAVCIKNATSQASKVTCLAKKY
jgi:hypothetical protein